MASPSYDIKAMVARHDQPAKLLFALWETLAPCSEELMEEEQTILDAWNFDSSFGNGLCDLLANENYDVLAAGLKALRALNEPRLSEFADTVEGVFKHHGISSETGDEIAKLERLPGEERACLKEELQAAEAPFLAEIWNAGLVHSAALSYIKASIVTLSRRTPA